MNEYDDRTRKIELKKRGIKPMKHLWYSLVLAIVVGVLLVRPALAYDLSDRDQRLLEEISASVNSFTTMEATFVQESSFGTSEHGKMIIKRPGKFRIAYDSGNLLLSNGDILQFVDQELQEVQQILITTSPAELLIRPTLSFEEDVRVLDIERNPDHLAIRVTRKNQAEQGEATLLFSREDYRLIGWNIVDALQQEVRFRLSDHSYGARFPDRLFVFFPPPTWRR